MSETFPTRGQGVLPRWWHLVGGAMPGTIIAVICFIRLQEPYLEMAALIPVFILTIFGFLALLGGGALFVITYMARGRASFFSVGVGLSGLIMITAYLLAAGIIPWL